MTYIAHSFVYERISDTCIPNGSPEIGWYLASFSLI